MHCTPNIELLDFRITYEFPLDPVEILSTRPFTVIVFPLYLLLAASLSESNSA